MGHYTRILLDEIFGKNNFRNEINVKRTAKHTAMQFEKVKSLQVATDSIFVYAKSDSTVFNKPYKEASERQKAGSWHGFSDNCYRPTMRYKLFGLLPPSHRGRWIWEKIRAEKALENYKLFEKALSKGEVSSFEEFAYNNLGMEFVRCNNGSPQYWIAARERIMSDTSWTDIQAYAHLFDFPTEKSELLIERVINMGSNPGDIVLDAFAGSGTTGAVAEKLGRRWIMIDCGKLAIYTMQKRLLNLRKGSGNKGKPSKPKPFTLYNAGLYDYKMVKDLPWDKYREFVLKVFQCRDEPHRIAGVELDGYLGADSVMVFNYKKHEDVILDREFIDDLHKILGDKVGYRFFIVVPAASVMFFEDYIEKGKTKYFVLRIPYSIIDELHRKGFTHIKQPIREADVNDTIDAVGFDFIQIPDVECEYFIEDKKGQVEIANGGKEAAIKIEKFKSNILSKKPLEFENRETLSMVMVDYNYNGEVFDFDDVFYAEDLKKNEWEVRFDADKIAGQMMIIYIDIFGNEKREVKRLEDFKERKKGGVFHATSNK